MDLLEGLRNRKTIRGFLQKKVPRSVIEEVLSDAHWAPSASNQQPWHFHVVTGKALSNLCSNILNAHNEKKMSYDPSKGKTIPKEYVDRTKKLFKELWPLINSLGDEKYTFIENGSLKFYEAPVVIFIIMYKDMPKSRLMDIGMAVENLMLSAHGRGLGTCAIALTLLYADVLNAALAIKPEFEIVLSVALGYLDDDFPINRFRSSREDIKEFITWTGFED
jgi:nitroreductase